MAVTINASTSAGLVNTADTSGVLALQTAGTTAVTVDASQRVGIGTASPDATLRIDSTNGARVRFGFTTGGLDYGIYQSDQGGVDANYFSNNVGIGVTAPACILDISGASGGQIKFPATQNASTDANTLDDYEEGTFTPSLTASSGSLGYGGNQYGKYTRIGNTVICNFWIQWTTNSSLSGAQTLMSGLPFNSAGGSQRPSPSVRTAGFTVTGVIGGWVPNGTSYIQINVYNNGGQNDVNASSVGASGEFGGTVIYQI
jgi:hypothetical protein